MTESNEQRTPDLDAGRPDSISRVVEAYAYERPLLVHERDEMSQNTLTSATRGVQLLTIDSGIMNSTAYINPCVWYEMFPWLKPDRVRTFHVITSTSIRDQTSRVQGHVM